MFHLLLRLLPSIVVGVALVGPRETRHVDWKNDGVRAFEEQKQVSLRQWRGGGQRPIVRPVIRVQVGEANGAEDGRTFEGTARCSEDSDGTGRNSPVSAISYTFRRARQRHDGVAFILVGRGLTPALAKLEDGGSTIAAAFLAARFAQPATAPSPLSPPPPRSPPRTNAIFASSLLPGSKDAAPTGSMIYGSSSASTRT